MIQYRASLLPRDTRPQINVSRSRLISDVSSVARRAFRNNTPVVSGRLRGGYRVMASSVSFTITNRVNYFNYVDLGTRHFSARMIVNRAQAEIDAYCQATYNTAFNRLFRVRITR